MSESELVEALELIDMESWLDREGVRYKVTRGSRGTQLNVKECPVCGNSNWKVYLNADSGLGNCFHGDCEAKFNKWSFIKANLGSIENRLVVDHVMTVAREVGWRPKKQSQAVNMDANDLRIPNSYPIPFQGKNSSYLANRGIPAEAAKYFELRLCKSAKFWYVHEGQKRYQDYSNRIIIPIFDLMGDLVSFQGRDTTGTAEKKYLFPPGFASTGKYLYNGHNAMGAEHIVINEGVFDVIATKIALDEDASLRSIVPVGSFGKSLSDGEDSQFSQLLRLKARGLRAITFMWDGEKKAIAAAVKAALAVRGMGFVVRVAVLPKDKDPNELPTDVVRKCFYEATEINQKTAAVFMLRLQ